VSIGLVCRLMRRVFVVLLGSGVATLQLLLLAAGDEAFADRAKNGDAAAIAETVDAWVAGWNAHDAPALGKLLTLDVDFVLVNGRELHGRDEFTRVHAEQFAGRYDQSAFAKDGEVSASLLKPDVALANWRWTITGVRNPDGTPGPTYHGIFTWVLVADRGRWQVRAAQNTVDK
jgi:uncharacterized protein (TIGR02246 family)